MSTTMWAITENVNSKLNKTKNKYVKKCGDLGHVAPLPPKKSSKSVRRKENSIPKKVMLNKG